MKIRSALAPTIIVAMIVGVMIVLLVTSVTEMIVTGMTDHHIVVTVPGRLPVARPLIMKNVDPGLHPPGGRKIEGLQGTMITDEEAMMTAEGLIIILTDAGTI
jgi:hypothetical protein